MKNHKKLITHIGVIVLLFVIACLYFPAAIKGLALPQGDVLSFKGMVNESTEFHEQTGEYTAWNSAMFSGMPGYQIGGLEPKKNVWSYTGYLLCPGKGTFSATIGTVFFYLIGFYVALACLGLSPWLALLGALAFGLGSYNLIIIEAGHMTKAHCMALMMPVLAGMMLALRSARRKKTDGKASTWGIVGGAVLFTLSITLQLMHNHIQITYYTAIAGVFLGLVYAVYSVVEKWFKPFAMAVFLLLVGCGFALGANSALLFSTSEYAKYTMRGGSEITVKPGDLYNENAEELNKSNLSPDGLNIDYAYGWSYGIGETYTLLVPGACGGGSGETVDKESASYKAFHQTQMPLYWGDQPFTSGPVYFGAIVIFLFILGLFVVKGPERWWILAVTVLSILMSWGRNFLPLNEWLFYHLPLYSKFRTPSMALTITNVAMVLMAVLALHEIFFKKEVVDGKELSTKRFNLYLYISGGITVGILLIGLIISGGLSYSGASDVEMAKQYGDQWSFIQNVFIQDRQALFVSDSWRSILFVLLAFAVLWLYVNEKIGKAWIPVVGLIALITIDLWSVDKRYLSDSNFRKQKDIELRPTAVDNQLDQYAAQFGDVDYRVLDFSVNTFNDAKCAAFHHQIGGYSAVKLRRYQDIIDFYISRHINWNVINMLNGRYIVGNDGRVQRNPDALGNAWFVKDCKLVANPDEEILAINAINPAVTAIIDTSKFAFDTTQFAVSDSATIAEDYQTPYNPGYMRYNSHSRTPQLAVFSEIYYAPDWRAYIDGEPAEYVRANYILRAMLVPAGDHVIEFRNEHPRYCMLNKITLAFSVALLVLVIGVAVVYFRRPKPEEAVAVAAEKKSKK